MTLPTLYEASGAYAAALAAFAEAVTEEEIVAALATLNQATDHLALKSERVGGLMREFELRAVRRRAEADWVQREADRLKELAASDERRAESIKTYLKEQILASGNRRLDTTRFSFRIQANPPAVHVIDPSAVPGEYQTTTITTDIDKKAIREHYARTGEVVAGVEITQGEHLRVR